MIEMIDTTSEGIVKVIRTLEKEGKKKVCPSNFCRMASRKRGVLIVFLFPFQGVRALKEACYLYTGYIPMQRKTPFLKRSLKLIKRARIIRIRHHDDVDVGGWQPTIDLELRVVSKKRHVTYNDSDVDGSDVSKCCWIC